VGVSPAVITAATESVPVVEEEARVIAAAAKSAAVVEEELAEVGFGVAHFLYFVPRHSALLRGFISLADFMGLANFLLDRV